MLPDRLLELGRHVLRHRDLGPDDVVALLLPGRDALTAEPELRPGRCALRHPERDPAVDRVDVHLSAEECRLHGDLHRRAYVVPGPDELGVSLDPRLEEEVARGAAALAGLALAGESQDAAVRNSRRDLERDPLLTEDASLAAAGRARLIRLAPGSPAGGARRAHREEPALGPALARDVARAPARGADLVGGLPALHAGAPALGAGLVEGHRDLPRGPERRVEEAHGQREAHVLSPERARGLPVEPLTEDVAEDVPEVGEDVLVGAETLEPAVAQTLRASCVVELPLLLVRQDLVGLGGLLELPLGLGVVRVLVRVVLERELSIRLLDLLVGGGLAHAEDLVVVLVDGGAHGCSPPEPFGMRIVSTPAS